MALSNVDRVCGYLLNRLQDSICNAFERPMALAAREESWSRREGGVAVTS
jgi:hypothetical protein